MSCILCQNAFDEAHPSSPEDCDICDGCMSDDKISVEYSLKTARQLADAIKQSFETYNTAPLPPRQAGSSDPNNEASQTRRRETVNQYTTEIIPILQKLEAAIVVVQSFFDAEKYDEARQNQEDVTAQARELTAAWTTMKEKFSTSEVSEFDYLFLEPSAQ